METTGMMTAGRTPSGALDLRDPAAVAAAAGAKARIEAAYQIALYKRRNEDDCRQRILDAVRRPVMADRVEYRKPQGGTVIKGPSIRFAELALREWGNVLCDVQTIYEDETARRVRVMVVDLETNTSFSAESTISKTIERRNAKDREIIGQRQNSQGELVFIVKATDDELTVKTQAAVSKILRNEGLRVIPSDIVDEAIEVARSVMADKNARDPEVERKRLLDAFGKLGVRPSDIDAYLGEPLPPKVIPEAMVLELRGIYEALASGDSTWKGIMEGKYGTAEERKAEGTNKAPSQSATDRVLDQLGKGKGGTSAPNPDPGPNTPPVQQTLKP